MHYCPEAERLRAIVRAVHGTEGQWLGLFGCKKFAMFSKCQKPDIVA